MKPQSTSSLHAVRRKRRPLYNYIIAFVVLILTTYVMEGMFTATYDFGDGQTYMRAYNTLIGLPISQAYLSFTIGTGAAEPFSFLLFYSFSQFVSISTMNFILNSIMLFCIFIILHKKSVNMLAWAPFVLTNFYLLIAEYSAIRLKIALVFLFLFWLAKEHKWRWLWTISMVVSHFQMIIVLLFQFVVRLFSKKQSWLITCAIFLAIGFILTRTEAIISKISFYSSGNDFGFPYKMGLLFLFSLVLIDRKKYLLGMFAVCFPIALIVGDFRLNIIYFLLIVHEYLVHSRRTLIRKVLLIIMAGYLSAKGLGFALDTFNGVDYYTEHASSFLP